MITHTGLAAASLGVGALLMWGIIGAGIVSVAHPPTESVAVVSAGPSLPLPTGWDTTYSQDLDIELIGQYDDSGPAAWDASAHPLVYVTTNGAGYGGFPSAVTSPGLAIIDAKTRKVVVERQYKFEGVDDKKLWEDHGIGASPDGKWLYLPTGDTTKPIEEAGRLLVINAQTLNIHQVIQTSSYPHHVKAVDWYNGTVVKRLVLVETFNWQIGGGAFSMRPGSGTYLLDPNDNNRVFGGFRSEDVQANPYLAFPHPDGRHLFVGLPPGPITDPDIRHNLEGTWAVIDMTTWRPVKYYKGGYDPIWTTFTADGKYAYLADGGSDEIFKIDNTQQKVVGTSRSSIHGGYGTFLNRNETKLYVVEKGEASHNRGTLIGDVNPIAMQPVDSYETHCVRGDHGILNPDPTTNEAWISYNSNFQDVVFDMNTNTVVASISHSGSSHNGAFVQYRVDGTGQWTGELLSDQSGFHGSARAQHEDALGVKEIAYQGLTVPVGVFRTT